MNLLFFDTETTALWDFKALPTAPHQPRLVQLGAVLANEKLEPIATVDMIVFPGEGIEIPAKAFEVHGISAEKAKRCGVSPTAAALVFDDLLCVADRIIAHNLEYDLRVMKRAFVLAGRDPVGFDEVEHYCTKIATTPICRIRKPSAKRPNDFKWPSLAEAHRYFFDADFEGAHNALTDVRACMKVYGAVQDFHRDGAAPDQGLIASTKVS